MARLRKHFYKNENMMESKLTKEKQNYYGRHKTNEKL